MRLRTSFRFAALLSAFATVCAAQSFTPIRELKNLSPAALEKLHTLETLNALPGGTWRFHAGDIPHGESPTLDDTSWQAIPPPTDSKTRQKAPKEAVWYRSTIEVPKTLHGYDPTGARIWFQFRADANGPMPEIIYVNGRRVALGDDLEPIVLFEPARSGEKALVAVKLLHTVDEKTWTGVSLRVQPATELGAPGPDSRTRVGHQASRPDPNDIRVECITAANLLPALPTPRRDLLPKVEAAIAAVDFGALAAANQPAFDASLRRAQAILAELHPVLAQANITLDGNAHIDAAWLWPRSETIDVVRRTFTTALQLMDEYPGYTFTQSAAQYNAWMADKYPEMNAEIARRIKEGRWEIVGGMWVEPDLNIPDGESLVRQLLVGQRTFKDLYGVQTRIGWNPDSFGYNWQLPQIYKRSGLDYFVTQKMHWNDTNQLPFRLFWWQSPDGSKVLTYFPTDYAWDNVNPTRLAADFAESAARNPGTVYHLDLYGIGDHGGGPTRDILDGASHWMTLEEETGSRKQEAAASSQQQSLSSRPGPNPSTVSSRPEREARSGEIPVFAAARAEGPSPNTGVDGPSTPPTALEGQRPDIYQPGAQPQVHGPSKDPRAESPTHRSPGAAIDPAALPTLHYGTAQSFFSQVEQHLNPEAPTWNYDKLAQGWHAPPTGADGSLGLPTWRDELYFEYHRGIYTSQAAQKRNIRQSEAATLTAEKLSSFAWLMGANYPAADLTENWKKITFNQFHDLAAGSGISVIYRDAKDDFTQVFRSDREISDIALNTLAARIDTSASRFRNGAPIVLFNSLAWPRSGVLAVHVQMSSPTASVVLLDEANHPVLMQVVQQDTATSSFDLLVAPQALPALGYTTLRAISSSEAPKRSGIASVTMPIEEPVRATTTADRIKLVNNKLSIDVEQKTGCMSSIAATSGPEYLELLACGNQLQAFADNPKNYDAWNIDPGTLDKPMTPISTVDSIALVADGPLRKTVRIQRTWQHSHFTQDISLDAGADFVHVDTTVDWHESHVLLKAAFPLAATSGKATFEIPYGSIQRATTRDNSFTKAQFEVPALRWADLGDEHQGVSILNDSKYGYDGLGNTLRLTLLRSPTWPDPDADRGLQHFTYEIYPHTGPWQQAQTVRRGYELNNPLTAQQVFAHTGSLPPTHSFASIDNPNITLTAVKKAEDANALIFRFYEWAGQSSDVKLHIPPGATYAVESNLMEQPLPGPNGSDAQHLPLAADTVLLPIKPFEIRTIEVFYPAPATPQQSIATNLRP